MVLSGPHVSYPQKPSDPREVPSLCQHTGHLSPVSQGMLINFNNKLQEAHLTREMHWGQGSHFSSSGLGAGLLGSSTRPLPSFLSRFIIYSFTQCRSSAIPFQPALLALALRSQQNILPALGLLMF